jgi:hypothetical protein
LKHSIWEAIVKVMWWCRAVVVEEVVVVVMVMVYIAADKMISEG